MEDRVIELLKALVVNEHPFLLQQPRLNWTYPGYVDTRPFGGHAILRYPDNAKDTLSIPG